MQWVGHRRTATFALRDVPRSPAEWRDLSRAASWAANDRATLSVFASGAVADAQLERVDIAPLSESPDARTLPSPRQVADRGPNCKTKRLCDVVLASIGLLVLLPLLVMVALAIRIDSRGPIFFRQWRGGHNGRRFQILKFRTMTCLEDGKDVCQARRGDARVTRVGGLLRKTSLDELPQLFNVLRGDMSMVGPRPHALVHDEIYSALISRYFDRQQVRPGITGWAQVNGCRGETRELAAMERRVRRDLEYIHDWSLRLDFIIIMKTVNELLHPKNVY